MLSLRFSLPSSSHYALMVDEWYVARVFELSISLILEWPRYEFFIWAFCFRAISISWPCGPFEALVPEVFLYFRELADRPCTSIILLPIILGSSLQSSNVARSIDWVWSSYGFVSERLYFLCEIVYWVLAVDNVNLGIGRKTNEEFSRIRNL